MNLYINIDFYKENKLYLSSDPGQVFLDGRIPVFSLEALIRIRNPEVTVSKLVNE